MDMIQVKEIKELNYDICETILRNRYRSCIIHCPSPGIVDSLTLYMTEIGIPWSLHSNAKGIVISTDYDLSREVAHICVVLDGKLAAPKKENGDLHVFWLRDIEQEVIDALVTDPATFDIDKVPLHLQNEEIRKMFLKTFIIAESEIDIISPWMNFSVVNDSLISLMQQALQRGVTIRIIYGLLPGSDEFDQMRSSRSDQVATRLSDLFSEYGDLFSVSRDNIHYKLVLCDEKYKLEGGYNYLSFTGDYSDPKTRREGSPFGRNIDEIRYLRKEYFQHDSMA